MLPTLHRELAHCVTADRLRRAEALRADGRAGRGPAHRGRRALAAWARSRRARRSAGVEAEIRVRFATERDRATWPDLEWQRPEQVLVADYDGAPHAALSLVDGAVLALGARGPETSRGGPHGPPLGSQRFERPPSSGSDRS